MKLKFALIATLLALSIGGQANAQSQLELNARAGKDRDTAKSAANKAARAVATKYSSVKNFKTKMDESQELYANFITGHLRTIFPVVKGGDAFTLYGSINPMCSCQIEGSLWWRRSKELNDWSKSATKKSLAELKTEYAAADKKLNDIYVQVRKSPAKNGEVGSQFSKELVNAEVEWIAFRNSDSELCMMSGGAETCKYEKMIALTKERTAQLTEWIKGLEEGDPCAGSRPIH